MCLLEIGSVEIIFIVVQVVFATMAGERITIPKGTFEEVWKSMFSEKSLQIKTIEQSVFPPLQVETQTCQLECCGFASVKDRVYPFPGKFSNASACVDLYSFDKPCFPPLQSASRRIAISLLVVVILTLIGNVPPPLQEPPAYTAEVVSFWFLIRAGFKKAGFGFLFQSYRDVPTWGSEVGERAPFLENHPETNLEEGTVSSEQRFGCGSVVDPSVD